ncbi:MAG: hypothetical protein KDA75_14710 [Planctomycetaceae bacterium]|nr:hypothetical protein [Planctomycetaceae bacterium]
MSSHRRPLDDEEPADEQSNSDPEAADLPAGLSPRSYSFWIGALLLHGSVTPRVIGDVLGFGLLAMLTVIACSIIEALFGANLQFAVSPFSPAGAVLGLLLVLRINAGYDRWWEARKLWGGIVNQSRNLGIIALSYGPADKAWRVRLIRWLAAYPHIVRRSLRGERTLPEIERLLGKGEAANIASAQHMPDFVSREIAALLRMAQASGMNDWSFYEAERQRGLLIDYLGGCERILRTPLARATVITVRRFIFLFLATLPFALLHQLDSSVTAFTIAGVEFRASLWLIPLFIMLLAYPLLALDRIGMELQNPFDRARLDHLPLDRICVTIETNLIELLNLDSAPGERPLAPQPVVPPPDATITESLHPFNTDVS